MNALKPPYVIKVVNMADLAPEVKQLIPRVFVCN